MGLRLSYGQEPARPDGVHGTAHGAWVTPFLKPPHGRPGNPEHSAAEPPRGWPPMRPLLSLAAALTLGLPLARAESNDPLRFFPEQTDVILKVEKPRALVEAVVRHDLATGAMGLQVVRDFLDSASYR